MLKVNNLFVYYGLIQAVRDINFEVKKGQTVSLIGSNGAGKTSTLYSIVSGVKKKAKIIYNNIDISSYPTYKIIKNGIALVPEGRRVFVNLTIEENLRIGAFNNDDNYEQLKSYVYKLFPRLANKRYQLARTISGGEQQMLAIGRALMSSPKLLMLDEPSLGLAPKIIGELFETIVTLKENGITVLLVEQNAYVALDVSNWAYVIENGKIVLSNTASNLIKSNEIKKKYLGG